ncbi:MAG: nucleoside monophosphate kinase [Candidatus Sumerlaeia bacterium]|nr:nucleoside monophosphate kinase [Candidatus Sumerlaeia bacterium]
MSKDTRYRSILLVGPPGVGKGTQGAILGRIPGFFHVSIGDVLRALDVSSDVGRTFYEYSSRGELVPDEIIIELWKRNIYARTILSYFKPDSDVLVLDGIPRNVNQARLLEEHVRVLKVIHLVCHDEEAMIRRIRKRAVKQNRPDDAREEVIRRRWEVYREQTQPVLDFYPKEIIADASADAGPGTVLRNILRIAVPVQELHFRNALD